MRTRTSVRWLVVPSVAMALGTVLAACGGGGGSSLSKADFLTQADAICTRLDKQSQTDYQKVIPADTTTKPADATLVKALGIIIKGIRQEADGIDALKEPSSISSKVTGMLTDLRSGADKAEKAGAAAFADNAPDYFATAAKDAKDLGLKVCGQGG